jgi:hypothetical protein
LSSAESIDERLVRIECAVTGEQLRGESKAARNAALDLLDEAEDKSRRSTAEPPVSFRWGNLVRPAGSIALSGTLLSVACSNGMLNRETRLRREERTLRHMWSRLKLRLDRKVADQGR